jgi:hypothetical protein
MPDFICRGVPDSVRTPHYNETGRRNAIVLPTVLAFACRFVFFDVNGGFGEIV